MVKKRKKQHFKTFSCGRGTISVFIFFKLCLYIDTISFSRPVYAHNHIYGNMHAHTGELHKGQNLLLHKKIVFLGILFRCLFMWKYYILHTLTTCTLSWVTPAFWYRTADFEQLNLVNRLESHDNNTKKPMLAEAWLLWFAMATADDKRSDSFHPVIPNA